MTRFALIGQADQGLDTFLQRCTEKGLDLEFLPNFETAVTALSRYDHDVLLIQNQATFLPELEQLLAVNPLLNGSSRLYLGAGNAAETLGPRLLPPYTGEAVVATLATLMASTRLLALEPNSFRRLLLHCYLAEWTATLVIQGERLQAKLRFLGGLPLHVSHNALDLASLSVEEQRFFTAEQLLTPEAFVQYLTKYQDDIPQRNTLFLSPYYGDLLAAVHAGTCRYRLHRHSPAALTHPREQRRRHERFYRELLAKPLGGRLPRIDGLGIVPNALVLRNLFALAPDTREVLKHLKIDHSLTSIYHNVRLRRGAITRACAQLCSLGLVLPFPRGTSLQPPPEVADLIDAYLPVVFVQRRRRAVLPVTALLLALGLLLVGGLCFFLHWSGALPQPQRAVSTVAVASRGAAPSDLASGLDQAEHLLAAGDLAGSRGVLEATRSLATTPADRAQVLLVLGKLETEAGNHLPALRALEQALALTPDQGPIHLALGNLHLARFRLERDLAAKEAAVRHYFQYLERSGGQKNQETVDVIIDIIDYLNENE
ncbi:MAG: hypothetical protein A2284_12830 [Deltaproteobacteria bacterium RIFOXYA12_FULL_61_11]|nr:MAG: hypothetical protein A2284_12830 [Deltaproteobacteria bacterium RIFOXYA12_FULL_61_11]